MCWCNVWRKLNHGTRYVWRWRYRVKPRRVYVRLLQREMLRYKHWASSAFNWRATRSSRWGWLTSTGVNRRRLCCERVLLRTRLPFHPLRARLPSPQGLLRRYSSRYLDRVERVVTGFEVRMLWRQLQAPSSHLRLGRIQDHPHFPLPAWPTPRKLNRPDKTGTVEELRKNSVWCLNIVHFFSPHHTFTPPPPPYTARSFTPPLTRPVPVTPAPVTAAVAATPPSKPNSVVDTTVSLASPLLVNLLQTDGKDVQGVEARPRPPAATKPRPRPLTKTLSQRVMTPRFPAVAAATAAAAQRFPPAVTVATASTTTSSRALRPVLASAPSQPRSVLHGYSQFTGKFLRRKMV